MVVTFGSWETKPTMLRNKRAACRDGTSADGERNNGVCGAKMPHSTQFTYIADRINSRWMALTTEQFAVANLI